MKVYIKSSKLGPRQQKELNRLIQQYDEINIGDMLYTSTTMGRAFDAYLRNHGLVYNKDFGCPPFQEGQIVKLSDKALS